MNKRGFTLLEITISIILMLGITLITVNIIKIKKANNELEKIEKTLFKAADVYLTMERDEEGKLFIEQINNGGAGVIIPLTKFLEKGYINDKLVKSIEKEKGSSSFKDNYILALLGDGNLNNDCSGITLKISWDSSINKEMYLCKTEKKHNSDNYLIFLVDDSCTLSDSENYKVLQENETYTLPDVSCNNKNFNFWQDIDTLDTYRPFSSISINKTTILKAKTNNLTLVDRMYASPGFYDTYYDASVKNNHISFAGHNWKIIGLDANGNIKIVKDESIGTSKFNDITFSYNEYSKKVKATAYEYYNSDVSYQRKELSNMELSFSPYTSYSFDLIGFDSNTGKYTFDNSRDIPTKNNKDSTRKTFERGVYFNSDGFYASGSSSNLVYKILSYNGYYTINSAVPDFALPKQSKTGDKLSSTIKLMLEDWYNSNLLEYDNYIAESTFCNDTSGYTGLNFSKNSTYPYNDCYNSIGVGGKIKSKIGLLTFGDIINLGIDYDQDNDSFLKTDYSYWTMTSAYLSKQSNNPFKDEYYKLNKSHNMFVVRNETVPDYSEYYKTKTYSNSLLIDSPNSEYKVRPVIVLKKDVEVLNGDGTAANPYKLY